MNIEDYDYIDESNETSGNGNEQPSGEQYIVFIENLGKGLDDKYNYRFYTSSDPESVFAEGWGEIPACNVPRDLINIDDDMYDYVLECKTDIKIDLAQDCCCFSMQDARDHIFALAFENLDNVEEYPDPRIVIQYGDPITEVEQIFAKRDIPMNYIE